jgi:membrane-associated phospholipid phosphatase
MGRSCRTSEKWIASTLLLAPLLVLCVRFFDIPLALYVQNRLYGNSHWLKLTGNLPDLLLVTVLLTTFVACSIYLVRTKKGVYDTATRFAQLLTWTAPVSYLMKSLLKLAFGRVNTRYWLTRPDLYGFHWFERREGCDGFPSGHMLVIVALLAVLWRCYPKSRPLCLVTAALLGTALIATNYHFLSDVIAGSYLGVAIEAVVFRMLLREPRKLADPASR